MLQLTSSGNFLLLQNPHLSELLINALRQATTEFKSIQIGSSLFSSAYKVLQDAKRLVFTVSSHDNFITKSVTDAFNAYLQGGTLNNTWIHTFTDRQVFQNLRSASKLSEENFKTFLSRTFPMALLVFFYVTADRLVFSYQKNAAIYMWTVLTYYALQSIAAISYGQLLSAKLKGKLLAIALLLTLNRFELLDKGFHNNLPYINLIAKKEQVEILPYFEMIFEDFKAFADKRPFHNELPKILWELFNRLDIIVKYPAILYFTSRFPIQTSWFLSMNSRYSYIWWIVDLYQHTEMKMVTGLFKPQKDVIKKYMKTYTVLSV